MKSVVASLFLSAPSLFATTLGLGSVKQVVYVHGADTDVEMRIVDVPFVSAYASPEWLFSAVAREFIPPSDGSWVDRSDINMASVYGIGVSGTYSDDGKAIEVVIDVTNAQKPKGYPFEISHVVEKIKESLQLTWKPISEDMPPLKIEVRKNETLATYIDGFMPTHKVLARLVDKKKEFFIVTYLSGLKLRREASTFPAELKYDLWRHYVDCYHLCEVIHHQTYNLPEELPIFTLLEAAFPGFKKASKGEGGIWISQGFEFLQQVDPHEDARRKALGERVESD